MSVHKRNGANLLSISRGTTVLIMDITYGIQGEEALPFIKTAVEVVDTMAIAAAPGAFLVDQISVCK